MYKYKYEKYKKKYMDLIGGEYIFFGKKIQQKMRTLKKVYNPVICTYNVWSNEDPVTLFEKRLPHIVDIITKDDPDIICLQDVSKSCIEYFKTRDEIVEYYYFIKKGRLLVLSKYKPQKIKYAKTAIVVKYLNLVVVNFVKNIPKVSYNNVIYAGDFIKNVKHNLVDTYDEKKNDWKWTTDTIVNKMGWNMNYKRILKRSSVILYKGKLLSNSVERIGEKMIFSINKTDGILLNYLKKNKMDKKYIKTTNEKVPYWGSIHFGLLARF